MYKTIVLSVEGEHPAFAFIDAFVEEARANCESYIHFASHKAAEIRGGCRKSLTTLKKYYKGTRNGASWKASLKPDVEADIEKLQEHIAKTFAKCPAKTLLNAMADVKEAQFNYKS